MADYSLHHDPVTVKVEAVTESHGLSSVVIAAMQLPSSGWRLDEFFRYSTGMSESKNLRTMGPLRKVTGSCDIISTLHKDTRAKLFLVECTGVNVPAHSSDTTQRKQPQVQETQFTFRVP